MKLIKILGLLTTFIFISSQLIYADSSIKVENMYSDHSVLREINLDVHTYELDLDKDGKTEKIEIVRRSTAPGYISYYIYDSSTQNLLHSRENIYRGIVEVRDYRIAERIPIFNDENNTLGNTYVEYEYILESNRMVCISQDIKSTYDITQRQSQNNSSSYYYNPPKNEIVRLLEEVALSRGIPPTILKAIAYTESNYRQFKDGQPLISFDGVSVGIMQVTPKFYPELDIERLKYDIKYNIEAGADILLGKWDYAFISNPRIPIIGNGDMRVLENWYFAIWAYNGLSESNNPNMIPYNHGSWIQYEAYQDKVLRHAKLVLNQDILTVPKELIPSKGLPNPKVHYDELVGSKLDKYRLYVKNQLVKVYSSSGLKLRDDNMNPIKTIKNGQYLRIIDSPILYSGHWRYKVQEIYSDGSLGEKGLVATSWILPNDNVNKSILVWQNKKDISRDKIWTIRFNIPLDSSSISDSTIYIEDSNCDKIPAIIHYDNDNTQVKVEPVALLKSGFEYALYIRDIRSMYGNGLNEYIQMKFIVE